MFGLPIPLALGRPLAWLLAAACLLLVGRGWGQHSMFMEWMASIEAARVQAVKTVERQTVVSERVRVEYRDRIVQLAGTETVIEKEVTNYVEGRPLALACLLDDDWLRLHNAAAAGALPPPAGGADGAGPGRPAAPAGAR